MKDVMTAAYIKGDEYFNFDFYTDLSMANKLRFVNSVTDIIVGDDNYNSIIRDLVFDFYIIDVFTNIDTSDLKESSFFIDDVEQFLEDTNIVDIVKENVKYGLIDELNSSVNLNIEYRTGIHINQLNNALTNLVNTIEKKINEVDLDSMMEMAKKFAGMTDELTPENIVNAYIESDMHKNNLAEIEESKTE